MIFENGGREISSAPQLSLGKFVMQRISGFYIYRIGYTLHPLAEIYNPNGECNFSRIQAWIPLQAAERQLEGFLLQRTMPVKVSQQSGQELLAHIRECIKICLSDTDKHGEPFDNYEAFTLKERLVDFETVLSSEMNSADLYFVSQKGAFDTTTMILNGEDAFPAMLAEKVPNAVVDLQQATRCIAFELPTAAGFHLHRANESVIGCYWDVVSDGKPRPKEKNMGVYLRQMEKENSGDEKIRSALKDIKNLHRNPLIHPEHSLDNVDDAIDLMGAIRAVVGSMLKEIPAPVEVIQTEGVAKVPSVL